MQPSLSFGPRSFLSSARLSAGSRGGLLALATFVAACGSSSDPSGPGVDGSPGPIGPGLVDAGAKTTDVKGPVAADAAGPEAAPSGSDGAAPGADAARGADAASAGADAAPARTDAASSGPFVPLSFPTPSGTTRKIAGTPGWAMPIADRLEKRAYKPATGNEMLYRLWKPKGYDTTKPKGTAGRSFPLVVYLNGYGGLTTNLDQEPGLYPDGLFSIPAFADRHPTFLFDPRLPGPKVPRASETWILYEQTVLEAIATLLAEFDIDPNRIYMTGHSLGGDGTYMIAAKHPTLFAALAPASSFMAPREDAPKIAHLPIWILHGNTEQPRSPVDWITRLRASGGAPHLTFHCGGHDGQLAYPNPSMWNWLFAQRRAQPEVLPPADAMISDPDSAMPKCYTLEEYGFNSMTKQPL